MQDGEESADQPLADLSVVELAETGEEEREEKGRGRELPWGRYLPMPRQ